MGEREQIDKIRIWFYRKAGERGYKLEVIEEVWEVLRAFASFGFCKAHAAAFALPTYQSAWLKAHHPEAFLAAVLTHDPGMYPKRLIVDEARSLQIPILGLDANHSLAHYAVEPVGEKLGIRIALADIKGIDEMQIASIISGRPYLSLADFIARSGAAAPIIERMIMAGGFDSLHCAGRTFDDGKPIDRRDLLLHAHELIGDLRSGSRRPKSTQEVLGFDFVDWQPKPSGLPPMSLAQRVRSEVEVLGIDLSAHVLDFYLPMLRDISAVFSSQLLHLRSQSNVLVAGVKVATQTPPIRSGRRVAFITLDDSTGPVDTTFFEDSLLGFAPTLFHSWLLLVSGKIRRTGPKGVSILANGCWELSTIYQEWLVNGASGVLGLVNNSVSSHQQRLTLARAGQIHGESQYDEVTPTRVWEHASGFLQSPYADVRPAGNNLARGMSHSSRMAPT
jgi:error-prone DNA polymerase